MSIPKGSQDAIADSAQVWRSIHDLRCWCLCIAPLDCPTIRISLRVSLYTSRNIEKQRRYKSIKSSDITVQSDTTTHPYPFNMSTIGDLEDGPPMFRAVSSSARQLFQLLNCIRFAPKVQVQISEEGLRFAVEESRVMQGELCSSMEALALTRYRHCIPRQSPLYYLQLYPSRSRTQRRRS